MTVYYNSHALYTLNLSVATLLPTLSITPPEKPYITTGRLSNTMPIPLLRLTRTETPKTLQLSSLSLHAQAVNEDRRRVATDMLIEKLPLPLIAKISKLSEDAIRTLANSLGMSIV